jgi:hypothetical protein
LKTLLRKSAASPSQAQALRTSSRMSSTLVVVTSLPQDLQKLTPKGDSPVGVGLGDLLGRQLNCS